MQFNPYTGQYEAHQPMMGMGAYAGPDRHMIHMDGLGEGLCTLEKTLEDNWHLLAVGFGAYVLYKILHRTTR